MSLPSSGSLSLKGAAGAGRSISQEVDGNESGSKSLTTLSLSASFTAPHSVLEFYGYPVGPPLPGAITGLTAELFNNGIQLSWSNPGSGGTPEKTEIFVSINGGAFTLFAQTDYPATSYYVAPGFVDEGSTYSYIVNANNITGDGPSAGPTPSILFAPPNDPDFTALTSNYPNGIDMAWVYNEAGAEIDSIQLHVSVNGAPEVFLAEIPYPTTTYNHSHGDLVVDNEYHYSIWAKNEAGLSNASVTSDITYLPDEAPGAPSNMVASVSSDDVSLSWSWSQNLGGPVTTFRIERQAQSSGTWSLVTTLGGSVRSYTDNNLASGQYQYRIRAENGAGNSLYANSNSIIVM